MVITIISSRTEGNKIVLAPSALLLIESQHKLGRGSESTSMLDASSLVHIDQPFDFS